MSNYLFSGYEFSSELKADFKLQNLLQAQVGEEQQMSLKLLNRQSEGFLIGAKTPYGETPQFVLDQIIGGVTQNIITLDSNIGQLGLNLNIDLGNTYKIQNSIDPTDDGDLTNKLWVENLARVRTIDLTRGTNGLSITKNTDIENPVFNIDLSTPLQNFSDLSTNGLVHKIGADNFNTFAAGVDGQVLVTTANTFAWTDLARVTSIGLTTNTSSLSISGGPVIDSGDINIDVSSSLQNLSNLAGTGLIKQTGVDTFTNFAAPVADNQVIVSSGGDFITTNFTRVTSIGLTSASTGLSITNTPIIDSGNINVELAARLENISNLSSLGIVVKDDIDTFSTTPIGSNGQFLGINGSGQLEWQNTGTVTSVGMTTSSGLSITGSPIIASGTLNLTLDTTLQNFNNLATNGLVIKSGSSYTTSTLPPLSGQILQSTGAGVQWVTPQSGGNVSGTGSSTNNALAVWDNTTGTSIKNSGLTLSGNDLYAYNHYADGIYPRSSQFNLGSYWSIVGSELRGAGTFKTNSMEADSGSYINVSSTLSLTGADYRSYSYGYINSRGETGMGSDYVPYGLICSNRIQASEFNATSSREVKNVLSRGEEIEAEALELFDKIEHVKYQYKDTVKDGSGEYLGVIAEELRKVAPHFVNDNEMHVPDIYDMGKVSSYGEGKYLITLNKEYPEFLEADVKILLEGKELNLKASPYDLKTILVNSEEELPDDVFVYGTYKNAPTVSYVKRLEHLSVVVKRLKREIEQLKAR